MDTTSEVTTHVSAEPAAGSSLSNGAPAGAHYQPQHYPPARALMTSRRPKGAEFVPCDDLIEGLVIDARPVSQGARRHLQKLMAAGRAAGGDESGGDLGYLSHAFKAGAYDATTGDPLVAPGEDVDVVDTFDGRVVERVALRVMAISFSQRATAGGAADAGANPSGAASQDSTPTSGSPSTSPSSSD